ncbi:MAG TPA: ferredoxin domain-containing protein [Levilinea sp.]|nr:ferredoxin domain-containing protein [Levilinea sp.]
MRCVDLGIAVGSATKVASLHNIDCRCQTRIAAAARRMGIIQADLPVALSMSVSHKNIFFDKKMTEVKFDD